MSASYTPGPWQIGYGTAGKAGTSLSIWRNDEGPAGGDGNTNYTRICQHVHSEADARLIAASPELLHALKNLLTRMDFVDGIAQLDTRHAEALVARLEEQAGASP